MDSLAQSDAMTEHVPSVKIDDEPSLTSPSSLATVLGLPYDCSLDTWSIGCTLYELYTGK